MAQVGGTAVSESSWGPNRYAPELYLPRGEEAQRVFPISCLAVTAHSSPARWYFGLPSVALCSPKGQRLKGTSGACGEHEKAGGAGEVGGAHRALKGTEPRTRVCCVALDTLPARRTVSISSYFLKGPLWDPQEGLMESGSMALLGLCRCLWGGTHDSFLR